MSNLAQWFRVEILFPVPPGEDHQQVAVSYDGLDPFYRKVFGGRVHHGLWRKGVRHLPEALREMEREIAEFSQLRSGMRVCDVGCGYGLMAADWVRKYGVSVTGVTHSHRQAEGLAKLPGVTWCEGDWMEVETGGKFDLVIAVESLEHFTEPVRALEKMRNNLAPNGRVVLACWTMPVDTLPGKIVRWSGRLHGMGSREMLGSHLAAAGLRIECEEDFSRMAGRTWSCLPGETLRHAACDAGFLRWLFSRPRRHMAAGAGVFAAAVSFGLGAAGYHLIRAVPFSGK